MYKLNKTFSICCSHNLWNYNAEDKANELVYGKCVNNHGHNYNITITLGREEMDDWGMVTNFNNVKKVFNTFIDERFDHKCLNDDISFEGVPATAENMAKIFYDILSVPFAEFPDVELLEITCEETDGASATYSK